MALTTVKNITITGTCRIDDTLVERYTAVISGDDPSNMSLSQAQVNKALVKANIAACRADRAEFEDLAYSVQDELLADAETTETDESTES